MPWDERSIGITAAALGDDVRAAPLIARRLGFAGLQFDAYSPALNLTSLSASGLREFRKLISDQDQQLVGLRIDLGGKGLGPGADVDRAIDRVHDVMKASAGLLAPLVCVDLGPLPEPVKAAPIKPTVTPELAGFILLPTSTAQDAMPASNSSPPPDPAFVSQVDSALAELGNRADRMSVMLAFRSELSSLVAVSTAIIRVSCPWFGIDLDPAAALHEEESMDEMFSKVGSLIRHVRGRDAIVGADRRTKPAILGRGAVQWDELLANLAAADYHGWITIDPEDLPNRTLAAEEGRKRIA